MLLKHFLFLNVSIVYSGGIQKTSYALVFKYIYSCHVLLHIVFRVTTCDNQTIIISNIHNTSKQVSKENIMNALNHNANIFAYFL